MPSQAVSMLILRRSMALTKAQSSPMLLASSTFFPRPMQNRFSPSLTSGSVILR